MLFKPEAICKIYSSQGLAEDDRYNTPIPMKLSTNHQSPIARAYQNQAYQRHFNSPLQIFDPASFEFDKWPSGVTQTRSATNYNNIP